MGDAIKNAVAIKKRTRQHISIDVIEVGIKDVVATNPEKKEQENGTT